MNSLYISNDKIGSPIKSHDLLQTIFQFYSSASLQQNKACAGLLLLEDNLFEILSIVRKSLRSLSTKDKEIEKDKCRKFNKDEEFLAHSCIIVHCLKALTPIVSCSKSIDSTIKLLYHSIILFGNKYLEWDHKRKRKKIENHPTVQLLSYFFHIWESFAFLMTQCNMSCSSFLKENPESILPLFPIPNPNPERVGAETSHGKFETTLSQSYICKIILDSLSSCIAILCTYVPNALNSQETSLSQNELETTLMSMIATPEYLHYLIDKIAMQWILFSLQLIQNKQHQLNQAQSNADISLKIDSQSVQRKKAREKAEHININSIYAQISQIYKYLWSMATQLDKILSTSNPKLDFLEMSLNIRADAISFLLLFSTSQPHKLFKSDSQINFIVAKNMEMVCTSAWKACAYYEQTKRQHQQQKQRLRSTTTKKSFVKNENNEILDVLSRYHSKVGRTIDLSFIKLYANPKWNIENTIKHSYIEYCAWRALQTSPIERFQERDVNQHSLQDKENNIRAKHFKQFNKGCFTTFYSKNTNCPFSFSNHPFVQNRQIEECVNEGNDTNDFDTNLLQATLFVIFVYRSIQHQWHEEQSNCKTFKSNINLEVEQEIDAALQCFQAHYTSFQSYSIQRGDSATTNQIILQCWKMLSHLKINSLANELIRHVDHQFSNSIPPNSTKEKGATSRTTFIIMTVIAKILNICVNPILSFVINYKNRISSDPEISQDDHKHNNNTDRRERKKFQSIAISTYLVTATLLERISERMEQFKNISSFMSSDFSKSSLVVEKVNLTLKNAYHIAIQADENESLIELATHTMKGLGRRRSERKQYAHALMPYIISCQLLTNTPSDKSFEQLSFLYAHIAFLLQQIELYDESLIAYLLFINYKLYASNSEFASTAGIRANQILLCTGAGLSGSTGELGDRLVKLFLKASSSKKLVNGTPKKSIIPNIIVEILKHCEIGQIMKKAKIENKTSSRLSLSSLFKEVFVDNEFTKAMLCYECKIEILREALRYLCRQVCCTMGRADSEHLQCCKCVRCGSEENNNCYLMQEIDMVMMLKTIYIQKLIEATKGLKNTTECSLPFFRDELEASFYYTAAFGFLSQIKDFQISRFDRIHEKIGAIKYSLQFAIKAYILVTKGEKSADIDHDDSLVKPFCYSQAAAVALFINDLWENFAVDTNPIEKTEITCTAILTKCIVATKSLMSLKSSDTFHEQKQIRTMIKPTKKCLSSILAVLYNRLCYQDSTILAALAASLMYYLEDGTKSMMVARLTAGCTLSDGQVYDIAYNLLDLSGEVESFEHQVSKLIFAIRSNETIHLESSIDKLLILLDRNKDDEVPKAYNKENAGDSWIKKWAVSNCLLGLAEAHERCGNLPKSLFYLRENCKLCRSALQHTQRESPYSSEANQLRVDTNKLFIPSNMVWRWRGRLAHQLRHSAITYSRLGDRRRAEDYAISALQTLKINDMQSSLQTSLFSDLMDCMNQNEFECQRIKTEIMSLHEPHPRQIAEKNIILGGPKNQYFFHSIEDVGPLKDLASKSCMEALIRISNYIINVRALIHDGNSLMRWPFISDDDNYEHLFLDYIEKTDYLINWFLTSNFGGILTKFYLLDNENKISLKLPLTISPTKVPAPQNLSPLLCSLKVRQASLLETTYKNSGDQQHFSKIMQLYNEVRLSQNAAAIDRGKACYHLGLISLQFARENGDLFHHWKGHSICADLNEPEYNSSAKKRYQKKFYIDDAILYFSEAAKYTGPASSPLGRNTLRCLALALGPESSEKSSSILVHRSIGSTARHMVAKAYENEGHIGNENQYQHELREHESKMRSLFNAFDHHDSNCENNSIDSLLKVTEDCLPSEWNTVAIALCPTGELLIASVRATKRGKTQSNVACIFPGEKHFPGYSTAFMNDVLKPFDKIIEQNRSQLFEKDHEEAVKLYGEEEARKTWWNNRHSTDKELSLLLDRVENQYFKNNNIRNLLVGNFVKVNGVSKTVEIDSGDEFAFSSVPGHDLASKFEAACTVRERDSEKNDTIVDDKVYREKFQKMTVIMLKHELEQYKIEKKILRKLRKAGLINLLISEKKKADKAQQSLNVGINNSTNGGSIKNEENYDSPHNSQNQIFEIEPCLFLVLDENLHRFPWEGMNMLRTRSVCRVPSLPFVIGPILENNFFSEQTKSVFEPEVNLQRVNYVLDPEQNLTQTRKRLEPILQSFSNRMSWRGVTGEMPHDSFINNALTAPNSMYIYCGHGGGETCFNRSKVDALVQPSKSLGQTTPLERNCRRCTSIVILMGCSSATLHSISRSNKENIPLQVQRYYEPDGIATSYLNAGAPCVIGNLWDVTDRDIDRFFVEFLETFIDNNNSLLSETRSLPQCVANARNSCKMQYIVGCAPVCYGVPVIPKRS